MFTGIVEGTGEIIEREESTDGLRLQIAVPFGDELSHGQSIAISGVCLTVEAHGDSWFETFLAEETRNVTYLGELDIGDEVNIERAMPADGRYDGHIVQGHVDGVTTVTDVSSVDEDWRFTFDTPEMSQYLVSKGSIAIDGISLTIAELREDTFDVAIIPETYELTTLSEKQPGDPVHIEYDVIAKYVEGMLEDRNLK